MSDGSDTIIDGLLTLVLVDGTVIIITDLDGRDYEIEPVPSDPSRVQIRFIEPDAADASIGQLGVAGSGSEPTTSYVDRLVALPINPLLPPTEYPYLPRRDFDWSGATGSETRITVVQINPAIAFETDNPVTIELAEFVEIQVYEEGGETIDPVTVTIEQLPLGTTASYGTLATGTDDTLTLLGEAGMPSGTLFPLMVARVSSPQADISPFTARSQTTRA